MFLVTGPLFPVCFLNQRWTPSLRFQVSHCCAFHIICDAPRIAVFCEKSIECVPGIASTFFFKLCVTIPVAPIITGTIVHFRFHIRSISMPKALVLSFFSASFCTTFRSAGIIIIIIIIITQDIESYARETNPISKVHNVDKILLLQFMVHWKAFHMITFLYFCMRIFQSTCVVPGVTVFCSSLISCFSRTLCSLFLWFLDGFISFPPSLHSPCSLFLF